MTTQATASVTVVFIPVGAGGYYTVEKATVDNPGLGYTTATISFTPTVSSPAQGTVACGSSEVQSITISNGGTYTTNAVTCFISAPNVTPVYNNNLAQILTSLGLAAGNFRELQNGVEYIDSNSGAVVTNPTDIVTASALVQS